MIEQLQDLIGENNVGDKVTLDENELCEEWSFQKDGASLISRLLFEELSFCPKKRGKRIKVSYF